VNDHDFTDLLRVVQLAIHRGPLTGDETAALAQHLIQEYPSRDEIMNRELVRLLVALQVRSAAAPMVAQLKTNIPPVEKLHIGMYVPHLSSGLSSQHKLDLFRYYEQARDLPGGHSLARYVDLAARDLAAGLSEQESQQVLAGGAHWPSAALAVLMKLPDSPGKAILRQIKHLDQQLDGRDEETVRQLRLGIVAVLGRSRDAQAMEYLRRLYADQPSRREAVVMGLAQDPSGANWPLLVESLSLLDGIAAAEVLARLAEVDRKPDSSEALRQAILCGLRTKAQGGQVAVRLLEKWSGERVSGNDDSWEASLAKWQQWFAQKYPDQPEARLPQDSETSRWTYEELLGFLDGPQGTKGEPQRGALVFQNAQCSKCHRYGDLGDRIGPDLTTVSRRFHKKEILASILFPSHVISDQYVSKKVVTADGRSLTGIVAQKDARAVVLLLSDGNKIEIPAADIDDMVPDKQSVMPEGLLNSLSLEQIADLFAFLSTPPRTIVTSRRVGSKR
jgi:putative heme-binding domain-containing protein